MKALLVGINAKYIHSNLGIYSIWAYGLEHGLSQKELEFTEYTINQNMEEVLADIYQRKPEFLGFSCYIWNIEYIERLAAQIHKIMPLVPIWLGGPEVSFESRQRLQKYPWATGIMRGEGEAVFLDVLSCYKENIEEPLDGLLKIQGITLHSSKIIENPDRPLLSMDQIPFPYQYMNQKDLEHRIVYYETSRGCPFGCSYCLSALDKRVRFRDLEKVYQELQFFLDAGVPQVKFVDRTFNLKQEHTIGIWNYILHRDNGLTNFHFELSADLLRQEEIDVLKQMRPGLVQLEIGVQSTNPKTMKAIHRLASLERIEGRVREVAQGKNIHQHLDLIAGLPYEDYHSFRKSFNQVYQLKPDQLQLGFLKALSGAPILQENSWELCFMDVPPYEVLETPWISYGELRKLKLVEEMVERYYNSMQFPLSIPWLAKHFESPFDFYQNLGDFCHQRYYLGVQPSRLQNYQILLEFWRSLKREDATESDFGEDCLQEMLLFDLYARENLKNRPEFLSTDLTKEQKEWNRRFYQAEECQKKYLGDYLAAGYDARQMARMTHIEHFQYSLSIYQQQGILEKKPSIVLFDYRNRNKLSHQAKIVDLSRHE